MCLCLLDVPWQEQFDASFNVHLESNCSENLNDEPKYFPFYAPCCKQTQCALLISRTGLYDTDYQQLLSVCVCVTLLDGGNTVCVCFQGFSSVLTSLHIYRLLIDL